MTEPAWLPEQFEANRPRLQAVAYRMLGARGDAEDAVQEAWLRLSRADTAAVENLAGWLTTVVSRVCLDMLRARKSRREDWLDEPTAGPSLGREDAGHPERDALLADAVGPALLVILEALAPAERVAFVLHDMFDLPFEDIARILDRSPAAARQLASRARRRVRGAARPEGDTARQREIVEAFLAASREGRFEALLTLLHPAVVLRADRAVVEASAAREAQGAPSLAPVIRGAHAVADIFSGRAKAVDLALVSGSVGGAWAPGGTPRVAFAFEIVEGRITGIEIVGDPEHLERLGVALLDITR